MNVDECSVRKDGQVCTIFYVSTKRKSTYTLRKTMVTTPQNGATCISKDVVQQPRELGQRQLMNPHYLMGLELSSRK